MRFWRGAAVWCRGKASPSAEEEAEDWVALPQVFADDRPQADGNLVYYAADNSRLCVRRIVLALVKPGKFY